MVIIRVKRKFEVLGHCVTIDDSVDNEQVTAEEVVEYVQREADKIRDRMPNLEQGQLAVLVALKLGARFYLALTRNIEVMWKKSNLRHPVL